MEFTTWLAGIYLLALPADFYLESSTVVRDSLDGRVPTTELACTWKNSSGKFVFLSIWSPMPPRAGGVMQAAIRETAEWADKPVPLIETSVFQGQEAKTVVAFQRNLEPRADARLRSPDLTLDEMRVVLKKTKHIPNMTSLSVVTACGLATKEK